MSSQLLVEEEELIVSTLPHAEAEVSYCLYIKCATVYLTEH